MISSGMMITSSVMMITSSVMIITSSVGMMWVDEACMLADDNSICRGLVGGQHNRGQTSCALAWHHTHGIQVADCVLHCDTCRLLNTCVTGFGSSTCCCTRSWCNFCQKLLCNKCVTGQSNTRAL
jgi:hypothetical protein